MKTLLKATAIILAFIAVGVIGCQKDFSTDETNYNSDFNQPSIKNWYYKVFIKSTEYQTYNQITQGRKLPDWGNSRYKKVGEMEIVEFPLIKKRKKVSIVNKNNLTKDNIKRIAEATLNRISFIKTSNGQTIIRELDYIPDLEYLMRKNFDITDVNVYNKDNDFSGTIVTKKWNGDVLSIRTFKDGKYFRTVTIKETSTTPPILNNTQGTNNSFLECSPVWEEVPDTETWCEMEWTAEGYQWVQPLNCYPIVTGVHYELRLECIEVIENPQIPPPEPDPGPVCNYGYYEPCECQLYGINCSGGGGNGNNNSVQIVINEVINPCLNQVFNEITLPNYKAISTNFLLDFNGPFVNLIIKDNLNDPTLYGHAFWAGALNYEINFNANKLKHCSQEFIAATFLHEAIHAYLKYHITEYDFENIPQHALMLGAFFDRYVNSLKALYPVLTDLQARALCYDGLFHSDNETPAQNVVLEIKKNKFLQKINYLYPGTSESDLLAISAQFAENGTLGSRTGYCQ